MTKIVLGAAFICFSHSGKNFKFLRLNPQTIQKTKTIMYYNGFLRKNCTGVAVN